MIIIDEETSMNQFIDQINIIMSKKKRDQAWEENGFEEWVSKLLMFIIIFTYILLALFINTIC